MDPLPTSAEKLFADTQWLQRVAHSLVRDPEAAEDLVQDTWLAALRHRGEAISNSRAWLRRLLFHRHISDHRRQVARLDREGEVARDEALPSTAELCERAELQRILGESMLALEEPIRTTVLLRFLEGLEPGDIAQRQGVPVNTVRWRLRRGVAVLRERLDGDVENNWSLALLSLASPRADALVTGAAPTGAALGALLMLNKTLLIASALVGITLASFYMLGGPGETDSLAMLPRGAEESGQPSAGSAPLDLEATAARQAVSTVGESEPLTSAVPTSLKELATLTLEAVSREDGKPLAGVAALPEVRSRVLIGYVEARERLSDADGILSFQVPANEVVHVQAWGEAPAAGLAVLDAGPFEPGEEAHVRIVLPTEIDTTFFGRIVDQSTGQALPDVRITPSIPSGLDGVVEEALTDPDGYFELHVPSWRIARFGATAQDYGGITFEPLEGHGTQATAMDLELPRAATLAGKVEANHLIGGTTEVVLEAHSWELRRPLPRPEHVQQRVMETWRTGVDASGRYRFEGLSAGVHFKAKLLVEGQVAREHPEELELQPGETREVDWILERGSTISGELVDQHAGVVGDIEVWLCKTRRRGERRLHSTDGREALRTTSNALGQFQFEDIPAGLWLLGPGLADSGVQGGISPWAVTVELDGSDERHEIRLEAWRDLEIHGVVLSPDGRPAARCSVTVDNGSGGRQSLRSNAQGLFVVGGLRAVEYTLTAGGMGAGYARSAPITLTPREEPIELRLAPSGAIQGRVKGASGVATQGSVLISAREAHGLEDDWMTVFVRIDGYFSADGLAPGLYDVFVQRKDDHCSLVTEHRVEAGAAQTELEVTLEQGGSLTPRAPAGERWISYELFQRGAFLGYGHCGSEDFETHLLPPGLVEIRHTNAAGVESATTVEVRAGVSAEVEL